MKSVLINIDVSDLNTGTKFYVDVFGLTIGRRIGDGVVELTGLPCPIYLLEKKEGSPPFKNAAHPRIFERHWTPVHLDFVVESLEPAVEKAKLAGANLESDIQTEPWGKIAYFADPFGNGFCLIQFVGKGYDEKIRPPQKGD